MKTPRCCDCPDWKPLGKREGQPVGNCKTNPVVRRGHIVPGCRDTQGRLL